MINKWYRNGNPIPIRAIYINLILILYALKIRKRKKNILKFNYIYNRCSIIWRGKIVCEITQVDGGQRPPSQPQSRLFQVMNGHWPICRTNFELVSTCIGRQDPGSTPEIPKISQVPNLTSRNEISVPSDSNQIKFASIMSFIYDSCWLSYWALMASFCFCPNQGLPCITKHNGK